MTAHTSGQQHCPGPHDHGVQCWNAGWEARGGEHPAEDSGSVEISKAALWAALAEVWEDEPNAAEWELAGVMASRAIEFFEAVQAGARAQRDGLAAASAWDEVYVAGHRQACPGRCTHGVMRNPYRAALRAALAAGQEAGDGE